MSSLIRLEKRAGAALGIGLSDVVWPCVRCTFVMTTSPNTPLLEAGDVLLSINQVEVTNAAQAAALITASAALELAVRKTSRRLEKHCGAEIAAVCATVRLLLFCRACGLCIAMLLLIRAILLFVWRAVPICEVQSFNRANTMEVVLAVVSLLHWRRAHPGVHCSAVWKHPLPPYPSFSLFDSLLWHGPMPRNGNVVAHIESLDCFAGSLNAAVDAVAAFRAMYLPSLAVPVPVLVPLPVPVTLPSRNAEPPVVVLVQRHGSREIINLDAVVSLFRVSGYSPHVIDPQAMPARAFLELMHRSQAFFGVHGAATVNQLFMQPGGSVIEAFLAGMAYGPSYEVSLAARMRHFSLFLEWSDADARLESAHNGFVQTRWRGWSKRRVRTEIRKCSYAPKPNIFQTGLCVGIAKAVSYRIPLDYLRVLIQDAFAAPAPVRLTLGGPARVLNALEGSRSALSAACLSAIDGLPLDIAVRRGAQRQRGLARSALTIDIVHARSARAKSLGAVANLHIFCRSGRTCAARPEHAEAIVRIARAYAGAATHGGSGRRFTIEQLAQGVAASNGTANESSSHSMLYTLGAREFMSGSPRCFVDQSIWASTRSYTRLDATQGAP